MRRVFVRTAFSVICAFVLAVSVSATRALIPVGEVVGIELTDGSVSVAAFDDATGAASREAGLQVGDKIVSVDDQTIRSAQDVRHALERADGVVELTVERAGANKSLTVRPKITANGPRLGVYLRQGITGVGTVTWYDPETRQFGALGHGVNTPAGELLAMHWGNTYEASVAGVQKGAVGAPGQLIGAVEDRMTGTLSKNTHQGIFGISEKQWTGDALTVAARDEVQTGSAVIRSTVDGKSVQEYSVKILKIYPNGDKTGRNMLLQITDPQLLETTGGIVQGMSGSPLVQDGKLIGAVTHVLVNDPTMGYGIFIENMLEAAG